MALGDLDDLRTELDGLIYRRVAGYEAKYFPGLERAASNLNEPDAHAVLNHAELLSSLTHTGGSEAWQTSTRRFEEEVITHDQPGRASKARCSLVDTSVRGAVLVLGLFQSWPRGSSDDEDDRAILELCREARHVFAAQPDRSFLHAFRICNDVTMEAWTFDRAGAYSGEAFAILGEPHRYRGMIERYTAMTADELGLNVALRASDEGVTLDLDLDRHESLSERTIMVDPDPLVRQEDLIGPGTTCYKGLARFASKTIEPTRVEVAIKFAWTDDEETTEARFLRICKQRGVSGVIALESYHALGSIGQLREGLQFGRPYTIGPHSVERGQTADAHAPFEDLRFECLVTSPLGRPLDSFDSVSQLLRALGDAVRALRSLYLVANILHRDVSPRNILLLPDGGAGVEAPAGILIDLDMALDLSHPPRRNVLVGSQGFMAIGILGPDHHTYRHDLESLFYVFLWFAICNDGSGTDHFPETTHFHGWRGKDFDATFDNKMRDMQPAYFAKWIVDEFRDDFEGCLPLALQLHELLFPLRNGQIFTGTDMDRAATERLYDGFIAAFDQQIRLGTRL